MDKEEKLRGYLNRIIQSTEELSKRKTQNEILNLEFPKRNYFLKLEYYLKLFLEKKISQRIILIPGLRGVGKTTILFQIYNKLLKEKKIPKEKMLYIDAGDLKNNHGERMVDLFEIYEKIYLKNSLEKIDEPIFIFIDEAHYDSDWVSFSKSLFDRSDGNKNVLIFVSGSSALALKTNTDLSRRAINDHLYPLNLQEFLLLKYNFFPPRGTAEKIRIALNSDLESAYHIFSTTYDSLQRNFTKKNLNIERTLIEFMSFGASPLFISGGSSELYFRWWIEILEKIIKQDIPSFSNIGAKNSHYIFNLLHFLAESPPSQQSLSKISGYLGISKTTVFNIFDALKKACLVFELNPDINPLKKMTVSPKYYFTHPTIRAALLWDVGKFKKEPLLNSNNTFGAMIEGLLASTFLRNKEVKKYILDISFDSRSKSADFIIKTSSGKIALEVTWGDKNDSQIKKTMENNKCKFGILVKRTNKVSIEGKIITVPRELFCFI